MRNCETNERIKMSIPRASSECVNKFSTILYGQGGRDQIVMDMINDLGHKQSHGGLIETMCACLCARRLWPPKLSAWLSIVMPD